MRRPFVLFLMAVLTAPASAAEAPGGNSGVPASEREQQPRACRDDVQKFCGQVKPGEGRVVRCMKENENNFSPACKTEMEKRRKQAGEKRDALREACTADAEKFCKGREDGRGGALRCLQEHEKELSAECHGSMPKRPARGGGRYRDTGEKPAR